MKCELCSMTATHRLMGNDGVMHFYCEHHAPGNATRIGEKPSLLKTYQPLIIAFSVIIVATLVMHYLMPSGWTRSMELFMGFFFLVFGGLKVASWNKFAPSFMGYDPLAKIVPPYAWIYPALEIALAILFLTGNLVTIASWATLIILGITTIGIIRAIKTHQDLQCVCLGSFFSLPLGWVTVGENALMIIMAIAMLVM